MTPSRADSKPGLFISLEGIDGSGTTTQCGILADHIRKTSPALGVSQSAEPSEGVIGKMLRSLLKGEHQMSAVTIALLFAADRIHHWNHEIEPALNEGVIFICDRYIHSSLAYQSVETPRLWIDEINRYAPNSHLSILLDIRPEIAKERRQRRDCASELFDDFSLQQEIAQRYLQLFSSAKQKGPEPMPSSPRSYREQLDHRISGRPRERLAQVDANQAPEAVAADIWSLVGPIVRDLP